MSGLVTISARREGFLALSNGSSTIRSNSLRATPPSCLRVLDASRPKNFDNEDKVEDEGPVLKVTPVVTQRAEKKIDAIFETWVLEST